MALRDLRKLPPLQPAFRFAGVYFVWREEVLVYVGSAFNVVARHRNHEHVLANDAVTVLQVNAPFHLAVEQAYITAYNPMVNAKRMNRELQRGSRMHDVLLQPEFS